MFTAVIIVWVCILGNTPGKLLEGIASLCCSVLIWLFLIHPQWFCISFKGIICNVKYFTELSQQLGKLKNRLIFWQFANVQVLLCTVPSFIFLFHLLLSTHRGKTGMHSWFRNRSVGPARPESCCYCICLKHATAITAMRETAAEQKRWLQTLNFCSTAPSNNPSVDLIAPTDPNLLASASKLPITTVHPTCPRAKI